MKKYLILTITCLLVLAAFFTLYSDDKTPAEKWGEAEIALKNANDRMDELDLRRNTVETKRNSKQSGWGVLTFYSPANIAQGLALSGGTFIELTNLDIEYISILTEQEALNGELAMLDSARDTAYEEYKKTTSQPAPQINHPQYADIPTISLPCRNNCGTSISSDSVSGAIEKARTAHAVECDDEPHKSNNRWYYSCPPDYPDCPRSDEHYVACAGDCGQTGSPEWGTLSIYGSPVNVGPKRTLLRRTLLTISSHLQQCGEPYQVTSDYESTFNGTFYGDTCPAYYYKCNSSNTCPYAAYHASSSSSSSTSGVSTGGSSSSSDKGCSNDPNFDWCSDTGSCTTRSTSGVPGECGHDWCCCAGWNAPIYDGSSNTADDDDSDASPTMVTAACGRHTIQAGSSSAHDHRSIDYACGRHSYDACRPPSSSVMARHTYQTLACGVHSYYPCRLASTSSHLTKRTCPTQNGKVCLNGPTYYACVASSHTHSYPSSTSNNNGNNNGGSSNNGDGSNNGGSSNNGGNSNNNNNGGSSNNGGNSNNGGSSNDNVSYACGRHSGPSSESSSHTEQTFACGNHSGYACSNRWIDAHSTSRTCRRPGCGATFYSCSRDETCSSDWGTFSSHSAGPQ